MKRIPSILALLASVVIAAILASSLNVTITPTHAQASNGLAAIVVTLSNSRKAAQRIVLRFTCDARR